MRGDLIRAERIWSARPVVLILEPNCGHSLSSDLLLYREEVTGLSSVEISSGDNVVSC